MGQANDRGNFEQRRAEAIKAGRVKDPEYRGTFKKGTLEQRMDHSTQVARIGAVWTAINGPQK